MTILSLLMLKQTQQRQFRNIEVLMVWCGLWKLLHKEHKFDLTIDKGILQQTKILMELINKIVIQITRGISSNAIEHFEILVSVINLSSNNCLFCINIMNDTLGYLTLSYIPFSSSSTFIILYIFRRQLEGEVWYWCFTIQKSQFCLRDYWLVRTFTTNTFHHITERKYIVE